MGRVSMKREFDVIVIGTGIGGCAAGALLADQGYRVLFLEKNERIGGACSYYEKEGVHVDVGAHFFSSGNGGPIGEVQRRLGSPHMVRFLDCNPLFRIKGPGIDVTLRTMKLHALLPFVLALFGQAGIPFREMLPLTRKMVWPMLMPDRAIATMEQLNVEDYVLASTRNPIVLLVISLFMGLYFVLPYWEASVGEAVWSTKKAFLARNTGYPKGGAVAVPKAFLDSARARGAKVRTNSRVRCICVNRGLACGVEDTDGRYFSSRAVVSNTSLRDTISLVGVRYLASGYRTNIASIKGRLSAVQAKILLDRPVVREGILIGIHDRRGSRKRALSLEDVRKAWEDTVTGKVPDIFSFYCPVPTNFDPDLAPKGMQLLTVTTAAPNSLQRPFAMADAWIDAMLEALCSVEPDIQKHIVWIDRFNTTFLEHWLGKTGGPVIATCQRVGQVGVVRHPCGTPVAGLFVVGDAAGGRGIGTELACRSAIEGAEAIMRAFHNGFI